MTTRAPIDARRAAVASPIPDEAPVTSTVFALSAGGDMPA
jgi:hypothetical protein